MLISSRADRSRARTRRTVPVTFFALLLAVVGGLVVVETLPSPALSASAAATRSTEAAVAHSWGSPVAGDEFNYTGAPKDTRWSVYKSPGHAGNGLRRPRQIKVDGSKVTITGNARGTTGGMSAKFGHRRYGRWETRMRVSDRARKYHPVLLLWPDSGDWPCGGEIDYAEGTRDRSVMRFFHHYSCDNLQTRASRELDATQWHNYAVEWTPTAVVGYLDGVEWFRDETASHQPPGSMHQTIQLDWFPSGSRPTKRSRMHVDWVRVYDVPAAPSPDPDGPAAGDVTIAAVGDMNGVGTYSTSSTSGKVGAAVAAGLRGGTLDAFFGLGDFQYDIARCADYTSFWNKTWAGVKPSTYWISAPSHDWQPGRNEDLDDFMAGRCPGDSTTSAINAERGFIANGEPYSKDFGAWHVAFLSSALWRYDKPAAAAATAWLDADLAAAKARGQSLAVAYHEPYFTSDTASHTRAADHKPWIDVMYKHRVKLTLSGSQHNYERSCPVDNADRCVPDGMIAFQVSTGGMALRPFTSAPAYIDKRFWDTHGYLELTLKQDGTFAWRFVPVQGPSTDAGSR
jgi:hypothetical protein